MQAGAEEFKDPGDHSSLGLICPQAAGLGRGDSRAVAVAAPALGMQRPVAHACQAGPPRRSGAAFETHPTGASPSRHLTLPRPRLQASTGGGTETL